MSNDYLSMKPGFSRHTQDLVACRNKCLIAKLNLIIYTRCQETM